MGRRGQFALVAACVASIMTGPPAVAADVPPVDGVDLQPLASQAARVVEVLDSLGVPLSPSEKAALARPGGVRDVQRVLDAHVLLLVDINPEQRVKVQQGPVAPLLDEHGWRTFLVKIVNQAGTTAVLKVESPNAAPIHKKATPDWNPKEVLAKRDVRDRWVDLALYDRSPFKPELSGLEVEYRLLQVFCGDRDLGETFSAAESPSALKPAAGKREPFKREARIAFNVGQGTQDLGFRNEADVLFTCRPATEVKLKVQDADGSPTMASFIFRDGVGRVYPSQARRIAPDFFFHPQIYRRDGEIVKLPPGTYTVETTRGPEYLVQISKLVVPQGARSLHKAVRLQRWIDPARHGWISGDHHIHAAGCAHYENPTQGVFPEDMWRHILGEDLRVGAALTWGPCYYFQKQFFSGKPHPLSTAKYVMRYDVEVSGFSSHKSGHLVLLRLSEQDYPGAKTLDDWPTLGLSVLRWAKAQGAVTGPAHSGWGLAVPGPQVPSETVPPFDGIGANEYLVQVTHEVPGKDGKPVPAIDFMSAVDTPYPWELTMWYHTLNAGFRTRLSGETDFPCIYADRLGLGRVYVKAGDGKTIDFDRFADGIATGQAYVSDGSSHLMDFDVGGVRLGSGQSQLELGQPGAVRITANVAALLPVAARPEIKATPVDKKPYWHIERARVDGTREVVVEVIVNGVAVAQKRITADGKLRPVVFDGVRLDRSAWVAMRILPSSHTNPVFVVVGGKPIRGSRRSVEWALRGVDVLWSQKERTYKPAELPAARAAYDHARKVYRERLGESPVP